MVRGGKRENAGRKPINPEDSQSERIALRLKKELKQEIEEYGIGNSISEKIKNILVIGLETIKENKGLDREQ